LFSSFVADILLRVRRHPDANAVAVAQTCFTAWRALFGVAERRLTVKQLAGLFGELHMLDRLLDRSPDAIAFWRGPMNEPHDFAAATEHIEVKTTLSSEDDVVHIHGIEQLTPPVGGRLHLAHIRVEVPSEHGVSVPDFVDRLREKEASGKLVPLLQIAGYHESHRETYAELAFAVIGEGWFTIDDAFPRLAASAFPGGEIPPALGEFRYSLDLAAVGALPVPERDVAGVIDAMLA
jgi:hypothetical protein